MEPFEASSHSFIVKVWREGRKAAIWRGQITHVSSNDRGYLQEFDDIVLFIFPYIEAMDVKLSARWRLQHWLSRRKKE